MSAESDFHALLAAAAPLTALVGNAIAQNAAPPTAPDRYCVFTAEHQRTGSLLGDLVDDTVTFTLQCWAKSATDADLVADAATAAIDAAPPERYAEVLARTTVYSPELDRDGVELLVEWTA